VKIRFVRSGGFAGLKLAIDLDTAGMSREEAAEIEALVHQSEFFDLPARSVSESRGSDRFEYRIRVASASRRAYAVVIPEQAVPDRLQPLLGRLTAMALHRVRGTPEAGADPEDPSVP
jgi:hypothetical protein